MKKAELIDALAETTGQSKTAAAAFLDAFINVVTGELQAGESVTITGFGSFSVSHRPARSGRNPQTGEAIAIKASNGARFSAGASLKAALN